MSSTEDSDGEEIFFKRSEENNSDETDSWLDASHKIGCRQNFTDCSNVFKAFIGSAVIGLPFAVHQAGIGLAVIGIVVIAMVTGHCCDLIVRCKRMVIANMMMERETQGIDKLSRSEEEQVLGKTLSFGRIGKASLGRAGLLAVNISVVVTQFGFTIGYFIFMGGTLRSVLKHFLVHNATTPEVPLNASASLSLLQNTVTPHHRNVLLPTNRSLLISNHTTTMNTTFVGFFEHIAKTQLSNVNSSQVFTYLDHYLRKLQSSAENPLSSQKLLDNSTVTFVVLSLIPLPMLIAIALVRNLRKLGPVSVIANLAITLGCSATVIYMMAFVLAKQGLTSHVDWFKFATFPVFFGQVTGAFEGIGTVIPIEGSMAENRRKYPCFLYVTMALMSFILSAFGVTGYLSYGEKTCQIVTQNLHGDIAVVLQLLLFVGVLFTYPLQLYPNIQILEHLYLKFKRWRVSRKKKYEILNKNDQEEDCFLGNSKGVSTVKVQIWEGNILRFMLVVFTACFAILFRAQFAYMAALTGSVGSSLLSYILPPLFYLVLIKRRRGRIPRLLLIKNALLIFFGIVLGLMGLTVTLKEIIESFSSQRHRHC